MGKLPCCTKVAHAEPKMHTLEKTMQRASPLGAQADCCTVFLFPAINNQDGLEMFAGFSFKIGLAFMYYEVIRRAFRLIDLATKSKKFIDVYRLHFSKKYGVAASS